MSSAYPKPGNGGGYSSKIDMGTDAFRKILETHQKLRPQPSVKGGIPPHLLRQDSGMASSSASAAPQPGFYDPGPSPEPQPGRQLYDPDGFPEPSEFGQYYDGSSHQQPIRAPAVASRQRMGSGGRSLMNSRWAVGNPRQGQYPGDHIHGQHPAKLHSVPAQKEQAQQGQAVQEHRLVSPAAPAGGVRLSVNTYGDWSPFQHGQEQQQQATDPEPLVAEEQKKKWRAKHSEDMSSQNLGSGNSSPVYDNDESICNFDADGTSQMSRTQDVRGAMAADLDLVPKLYGKGFKNKDSWNDYPEDPEERDRKWRPTYCQLWVKEMEKCEWPVAKWLGIPGMQNEECDVQPSNAWLMAPIEYPDTHINPEDTKMAAHDGSLTRRREGHANLKLRANLGKIKRRVEEREGEQLWEDNEHNAEANAPAPQPKLSDTEKQLQALESQMRALRRDLTAQSSLQPIAQATPPPAGPTPPPTNTNSTRQPIIIPGKEVWHPVYGRVWHEPRVIEDSEPPTFVKIPCFLRPAETGDLPQILEIYNWEVTQGIQALDTEVLSLGDMKRLFKRCQDCKTPLVVAVAGRWADSVARKKADAEPKRIQHWGAQQQTVPISQEKIIGFAFVSIMSLGLAGDVHRNVDRFQGEVHVYVANASRRNGVGRALLQQILVTCSRLARTSNDSFKFDDPNQSTVYETAFYNVRNYARLYVKFASRGKADPEQEWMSKFLDSENFLCISTMDKSRQVVYDGGEGDRGKVLDTLVYQHDCHQDPNKVKENVY